jgi:hypothetical protein
MKKTMFALTTIYLIWTAIAAILTGQTATTFAGLIIRINRIRRTITLQTMDGHTWALPVADSSILNQKQIGKGDQVRIEVDLSGRITKINKLAEYLMPKPVHSLDEVKP